MEFVDSFSRMQVEFQPINMMIEKKKFLMLIENLPDSFSIDELLDRMIFFKKIEAGLSQSSKGQSISTKQAMRKLEKWLE